MWDAEKYNKTLNSKVTRQVDGKKEQFPQLTFSSCRENASNDICSTKKYGRPEVGDTLFQSFLVVHHLPGC